jgi:hypothetical protein
MPIPPVVAPPCPDPIVIGEIWRVAAAKWLSMAVAAALALLIIWLVTRSPRRWWLGFSLAAVVGASWLAFDAPLLVVQRFVEHHPIGRVTNPVHGDLTLTWGAVVVVPLILVTCTLGWRRLPKGRDLEASTIRIRAAWFIISAAFSVAAASVFHQSEIHHYNIFALNSLSKIIFDFGTYGLVLFVVLFLGGVVLFSGRGDSGGNAGLWRWVLLVLLVVEMALQLHNWFYHLPPDAYHWTTDPTRWWAHCQL